MIIILNILVLITIFIILFIPASKTIYLHNTSLCCALTIFTASLVLLSNPMSVSIYTETGSFTILSFPSFVLSYSYMLDNISVLFVILSTFLGCIVVIITRSIEYRLKEKYLLLFIILALLINCFTTSEILFFYLFFEALLIPIFSLIGVWGSQKEKIFAANQFFLYTLFGSFFMLSGIILLIILTGSTNLLVLKGYIYSANIEKVLFCLFFMSFAIKVPMVPLHLWLPKAHVEAPTTGSVLLAGILLKLGSYGFLRFLLFLFPKASFYFLPLILSIAVISIISASFTVLRQVDLKRIIAYSSIAHMNYLVCALFVKNLFALTGSLLLQIAHGLSSSALFLAIGMLYDRYKSRNLYYYRGLVSIMPFFSFMFFIFSLANLGFPLTVNFAAELLIFIGLFESLPSISMLTLIGILLSGIYSLTLATRLIFGTASVFITHYYDLNRREFYTLTPIALSILVFGCAPTYLTSFWSLSLLTWFS